ncbi:MAG: acetylxylan esterase [Planctomycetes bacterium]|nr:acetylxylan esterase [Planctomycetota bacterium]
MRTVLHRFVLLATLLMAAAKATAAEPIKRSPNLPATTPWNLEALSEPPKVEWGEPSGGARELYYAGEPYQGKPTRVFAYYAVPKSDREGEKFPAVVLLHGGGGTAFREWTELWAKRGYAAIAMDLAGARPIEGKNAHRPENRERLPDGGPNQGDDEKFGSVDKEPTEQWSYHAVAAALRAHSLVRSFPEVDAERTAVTGISWGGYLTCIVAGVDSRFKAAVPVYGCGFLDENSAWLARFDRMTSEQRGRWVSLWDPSKYLPAMSMPIFFVNGTNDFAYPLDSYMKSYNAVPGGSDGVQTKQIRVTVNMPHGHQPGWAPPEIGLFVDQHLRGGKPLPMIERPKLVDGGVSASLSAAGALSGRSAELHYTVDDGPINKRTWKTVPAKKSCNTLSCEELPAEITAWFFTIKDAREAIVSSPVVITPKKG